MPFLILKKGNVLKCEFKLNDSRFETAPFLWNTSDLQGSVGVDAHIAPYAKKEKSMYAIAPYAYTHRCRAYGAIRLPSLSKVFLSARSVGQIA